MATTHAEGIEEWARLCSTSFVPLAAVGDASFAGDIDHRRIGDLGVSRVTCTRSAVRRRAKLIAADPRSDVLLSMQLTGTGRVRQADREVRLDDGLAALYEADREYELAFPARMSEIVLQIPRERLPVPEREIRELTARPLEGRGTSALVVLRHFLLGVLDADDFTDGQADEIARAASGLLTAVVSPILAQPRSADHETMTVMLQARIRDDMHDPDLSFDEVARAHGISRRYLDRLFARQGESPAAFLRRVRLEWAERSLRNDRDGTIRAVAHRAGFADVDTFIRVFRRAHGVTPGEWRREWNRISSR